MGNKNYLDASQKQAVCHCHGPALVLAGPGSGKTGTLIAHISYLLENHLAKPCELLVITYTKEITTGRCRLITSEATVRVSSLC